MAAITGLPVRTAMAIPDQVATTTDPLWLANVNSATQTVLSGTMAALEGAADAARDAGAASFELLDVSVASHCPLQCRTANELAAHLTGLPLREPTIRYLTNTGGRAVKTAEAVRDDLAQSVAKPVQWYDAARLMAELGADCAVEMHPDHVLTRLLASSVPAVRALSMQDDGLQAVATRARR